MLPGGYITWISIANKGDILGIYWGYKYTHQIDLQSYWVQ